MTVDVGIYSPRARRFGVRSASVLVAVALSVSGALAQDSKAQPKDAAAASAPATEAPWVKLCEKAQTIVKKDGKDVPELKDVCMTHHEQIDGLTGQVIVSAAVRQFQGDDKQRLMVMVPLGMAVQPGLRAAVYSKELWEKARKKSEKLEEANLKQEQLKFTLCTQGGCTAELELTKELISQFRTNPGLMIFAINANGQVIAFPVPLQGFGQALDGKPIDGNVYTAQRMEMLKRIEENQRLYAEEQKKQAEAAKGQQGGQQQPSSGAKK